VVSGLALGIATSPDAGAVMIPYSFPATVVGPSGPLQSISIAAGASNVNLVENVPLTIGVQGSPGLAPAPPGAG